MKSRSDGANRRAFTLVELLVIITIIGLLAAIIIPMATPPQRVLHIETRCANNLHQIGLGIWLWAGDNKNSFSFQTSTNLGGTKELIDGNEASVHFLPLSNYVKTGSVFLCLADAQKHSASNLTSGFSDGNLSYFIGLDASPTNAPTILSGDCNLSVENHPVKSGIFPLITNLAIGWTSDRHRKNNPGGNLLFADGHVEFIATELSVAIQRQGLATNRLAIP